MNDSFEILREIFGDLSSRGSAGPSYVPPKSSPVLDHVTYVAPPDMIERILGMYVEGVAILDIAALVEMSDKDVHKVIDHFSPYMGDI